MEIIRLPKIEDEFKNAPWGLPDEQVQEGDSKQRFLRSLVDHPKVWRKVPDGVWGDNAELEDIMEMKFHGNYVDDFFQGKEVEGDFYLRYTSGLAL